MLEPPTSDIEKTSQPIKRELAGQQFAALKRKARHIRETEIALVELGLGQNDLLRDRSAESGPMKIDSSKTGFDSAQVVEIAELE